MRGRFARHVRRPSARYHLGIPASLALARSRPGMTVLWLRKQPVQLRALRSPREGCERALLRDLRRRPHEPGPRHAGQRAADADAADAEGGQRLQPSSKSSPSSTTTPPGKQLRTASAAPTVAIRTTYARCPSPSRWPPPRKRRRGYGNDSLKLIAHELLVSLKGSASVDWSHRESARARMRVLVKRILRKYGYPPDLQDAAVQTVLRQAEALSASWAA